MVVMTVHGAGANQSVFSGKVLERVLGMMHGRGQQQYSMLA